MDLNVIKQIESSGNPKAFNKISKARGLHQITPVVVKEWNNFNPKEKYADDDMFDEAINTKVANWYMNKRIPQMLKHFKHEDNDDNRLIAYNAGIAHVGKKQLPEETVNYIKKYKSLYKPMNYDFSDYETWGNKETLLDE